MYLPAATLASHIAKYALTDNHHSRSPPSVGACTPHDRVPSMRYSVDDILQIILSCRKNWKTLKGQSEAVWPPYLEAIMLKALQEYEPDDSRETRMLGRYPMRNRFISNYIQSATGKHRSAKQVGSRLQQLRDTPEGRELIDILTRCYRMRTDTGTCNASLPESQRSSWGTSSSPSPSTISGDSSSIPPSPDSPFTPANTLMSRLSRQPPVSRMPVYIDILPSIGYGHSSFSAASVPPATSDGARPIRNIDPTVTFVSPAPVNGKSSYIVLLDGAPVHSEDTKLDYVGPYFTTPTGRSPGNEPILYSTALVPKYWDVLCGAADPTLYTIVQDVYYLPPNPVHASTQGYAQRPRPTRIFSAVYHFRYPAMADFTRSHGQASVDAPSSGGSSMTSAFHDQTGQGSMSVGQAHATSFAMPPSAYATLATELDQNLLDEPFMLDVNFEQITFDDFAVAADTNASGGAASQFMSNTYFM